MRQHIDLELQKRLRETVSQLALEHAYKLYEELQPQIESVVSQVVDEAVRSAVAKASVSVMDTHLAGVTATNAPLKK
jgi:hypothetical protein